MNTTTLDKPSSVDVDELLDRIKPEHSASGKRALNYKAPSIPKVPRLTNPKARIDRTTADTISRIHAAIRKDRLNDERNCERCAAHIEQRHGRAFWVAETDGHRALLLPPDGIKRTAAKANFTDPKSPDEKDDTFRTGDALLDNPELWLALKRAATMCDERSKLVTLAFDFDRYKLVVSSSHPDVGDFEEELDCYCSQSFTVSFHLPYLFDVLGSWPMRVLFGDPESHVVFVGPDDSFRYALMPLRK